MRQLKFPQLLLILLSGAWFFASCSSDDEPVIKESAQNYQVPAEYQHPDSATVVALLQSGSWREIRNDNLSRFVRFEENGSYHDSRNWNFAPHFFKWRYYHQPRLIDVSYVAQDSVIYFSDSLFILQIDPEVFFYQKGQGKALFRKHQE